MHSNRIVIAAGGAQRVLIYEYKAVGKDNENTSGVADSTRDWADNAGTWVVVGRVRKDWFTDDPSVDIEGDTFAVTTEDIGMSFVYRRLGGGSKWREVGLLRSLEEDTEANRGMDVRTRGGLVFTARNGCSEDDPGAVYVHDLSSLDTYS